MSKQQCIIGVDIGTSNYKSLLFDLHGNVIDKATVESRKIYDRIGPGWVEEDPNAYIDGLTQTVYTLMSRNDIEVLSICISSQRPTFIPVDENCRPVRLAITWQTTGTYQQVAELKSILGAETIYNKTGLALDTVWSAPMVKYVVDREPETHVKVHKYIHIQTLLLHYLGVEGFITDRPDASATAMYNINTDDWDDDILNAIGISKEYMSDVVESGVQVGVISKKAYALTGIPMGTPIISGCADSQCSALGAGTVDPGIMNVMIGTAQVGLCYSENIHFDPEQRVLCHVHPIPGKYLFGATILAAGDAYRWVRDTVYGSDTSYFVSDREAVQTPPGADGLLFLPHQAGAGTPYWDNRALGIFAGLTLNTSRGHMARSVMEGVAFEIAKSFNIIEAMGVPINSIRLTGGAARPGNPWNQIQADIYGKPVYLLENPDTGALGAAILAAVGIHAYSDFQQATQNMIRVIDEIKPSKKNHELYLKLAVLHDKIYRSLKEHNVYQDLSNIIAGIFHENPHKGVISQ